MKVAPLAPPPPNLTLEYHPVTLVCPIPSLDAGGVSFTVWGRNSCPYTAELVYQGLTVGSAWNTAGSAEFLCLHTQAQSLSTTNGVQGERAYLYGTEYRAIDYPPAFSYIAHHDAPCAVCYASTRSTKITIPERVTCPSFWTREYYGYLMTDKFSHSPRVPICVDANAESVPGANVKSLLYFIEARCAGIPCPPYYDGGELACVVCTR